MIPVPGVQFVDRALFFSCSMDGSGSSCMSMQRYFRSVKASRPWREPSRPMPDCFDAAERDRRAGDLDAVDRHHAVFERAAKAQLRGRHSP